MLIKVPFYYIIGLDHWMVLGWQVSKYTLKPFFFSLKNTFSNISLLYFFRIKALAE